MRQDKKPSRSRRKRCVCCKVLFDPNPRTKGKQRYCSAPTCQEKRQRINEKDWRERNPDCLEYQKQKSREWHREHPQYETFADLAHAADYFIRVSYNVGGAIKDYWKT